jgi:hypothetical protein
MADYNEQQANGKGGAKPQDTTDDQSSPTSNTTPHGDTYDSCGCTGHNQSSRKTFHPWEPETWECESDGMDGSSCRDNTFNDSASRDSAPSELDEFQSAADETLPPAPTGPRPGAADNRELYEDLVRSQRPDNAEATTPAVEARETGASEPMQWTLVDLSSKSCSKPGCDPATCDSEECEDEGRTDGRTGYQDKPEYATSVGETREPVTSYRFDLDREVGPAPEPMSNKYEPEYDIVETKKKPAKAEPKAKAAKRGGKKTAVTAPVFPEQVTGAAPAADPTTAAKPKKAGKAAGNKTAKKAAKKPAAKKPAKKTVAKKGGKKPAKKPTTPRGKKAGPSSAAPLTGSDPTLPTEKAA